jgi:DNA-binding NarL/FixJ family response regulator
MLCAAEVSAQAARRYQQSGHSSRARAAHARAQTLGAACEGGRTPALDSGGIPQVLTSRELNVAELAVAGLTSRQIATRLDVSVRTVDNHLQRVYSKLEVSSRRALATLLHPGSPR